MQPGGCSTVNYSVFWYSIHLYDVSLKEPNAYAYLVTLDQIQFLQFISVISIRYRYVSAHCAWPIDLLCTIVHAFEYIGF